MAAAHTSAGTPRRDGDAQGDRFWSARGMMCNTCAQKRWLDCNFLESGRPCNNCKQATVQNPRHVCTENGKSWREIFLEHAEERLAQTGDTVLPDPKKRGYSMYSTDDMSPGPPRDPPPIPEDIKQDAFAAFGVPRPGARGQGPTAHQYQQPTSSMQTEQHFRGGQQYARRDEAALPVPPPPPAPPGTHLLPPGWRSAWDNNSQSYYFVHRSTGRTQWEIPQPPPPPPTIPASLPPDWYSQWDRNSQRAYYIHQSRGWTQWEMPSNEQHSAATSLSSLSQGSSVPRVLTQDGDERRAELRDATAASVADALSSINPAERESSEAVSAAVRGSEQDAAARVSLFQGQKRHRSPEEEGEQLHQKKAKNG